MRYWFVFLTMALLNSCKPGIVMMSLPENSKQMMLVVAESETTTKARMFCFEKEGKGWRALPGSFPVCLGKNGMAWGKGLHTEEPPDNFPSKREGDGKSPAGIYTIGSVFGFAPPEAMSHLKMPYISVSEMTECVDDVNSSYYNLIVSKDEIQKEGRVDWKSSEKMLKVGDAYETGATVNHNMKPVKNGGGSCIFLHIWSGPDSYTAGCTSMSPENMKRLAVWMDASKAPVLVQLTHDLYLQLKQKWSLPEVSL